jgi:catechol 2,3-dioxygenase-like lactoylglutathione lyase family enzyme
MLDGIDHVVIAVDDLDAAAATLERAVGLACTGGGRHEGLGTANRIAFLADGSYVELMGVEDAQGARTGPIGTATLDTVEHGDGLAAYALNDDELPITVDALRASGSSIGPVTPGARLRPDGELVRWWTAIPEPLGINGLPFLIRHARYGGEWGPRAVAARAAIPHPAGGPVRLLRLDLSVPDPQALAALHFRQLGLEYTQIGPGAVCPVGRHVIRLLSAGAAAPAASVYLSATGEPLSVGALGVRWVVGRG